MATTLSARDSASTGVPAPRRPPERRSWSDAPSPRLSARMIEAPAPPAQDEAAPAPGRTTALDHLLTVLALLGLVMLGLTIAAGAAGLRPLVVRSGSMEPTITTGGMVIVRTTDARDVRVGDVVAVERPDGVRVTHRVLSTEPAAGGQVSLRLKGDANPDPDPFPVVVPEVGEVVYSAPWLGRASAELTSARGGFVLGSVVTAVLLTVVGGRRRG